MRECAGLVCRGRCGMFCMLVFLLDVWKSGDDFFGGWVYVCFL